MKHDAALNLIEKVLATLSGLSASLVQVHELMIEERRALLADPGPAPRPGRRGVTRIYAIGDEKLTLRQLAERAGCHWTTMQWRLSTHSPQAALEMGAASLSRRKSGSGPVDRLYAVGDEQLTALQLAERAGVGRSAIYRRLAVMSPAEAVAMGRVSEKVAAPKPTVAPKPAAAQTEFPRSVFDVTPAPAVTKPAPAPAKPAPVLTTPKSTKQSPWQALSAAPKPAGMGPVPSPAAFKRSEEAIVPAGVKRTVAPTPRGRYDVDTVPSTFGPIGTYQAGGWSSNVVSDGGAR